MSTNQTDDHVTASPQFNDALIQAFPGANRKSGHLLTAISRIGEYARTGLAPGAIEINEWSFICGLLATGQSNPEGSSAGWFWNWVVGIYGDKTVQTKLRNYHSPASAEFERLFSDQRLSVSLSPAMLQLEERATAFAERTLKRSSYELRHLIASLLVALEKQSLTVDPTGEPHLLEGQSGNFQTALAEFRNAFFERISRVRDLGEDMPSWAEILGASAEALQKALKNSEDLGGEYRSADDISARKREGAIGDSGAISKDGSRRIPQDLVPGFSTDRASADGEDSLGVDEDVQAFAKLICLKEARPPLSIGLFGGWGAGKSTFMERLQVAIRAITDAEAKRREDVAAELRQDLPKGAPGFLARITHIRFNAWQYSDANLWASLTTEFFDQLRAGGHGGQGRALHDRLVLRVKEHVNGLSDTAIGTRKALAESEDALVAAEVARDDAAAKVVTAKEDAVLQSLSESLAASYDRNKDALTPLGIARQDQITGTTIKNFAELVLDLRTVPGLLAALRDTIWNGRLRVWVIAALVLVIVAGLIAIFGPDWFGLISFGSGLAVLGVIFRPVLLIGKLFLDTMSVARKLKDAEITARKDLAAKEKDVRLKTDEVAARRATADRAETALARYAGPPGTPSSPRLLHFLLNDDPEAKHVEGQIGLISRARRLFQAIDQIAKEDPGEDVPERIVLYIDDLDRCSHEQVYAVLQAVHLLLAFELFVVVVGVDVAWVSEAIARQMRDGQQVSVEEETKRRKRAIDYLQKIFQIPFWLRPLTSEGGDGGSYGRFVKALTGTAVAAPKTEATQPATPPAEPEGPAGKGKEVHVELEQPDSTQDTPIILVKPEPLPPERLLETVQLDPREVAFLQHPAIGAIAAADPRGVKRMINTYRLARARLSQAELDKLLDGDAPAYPVLALFVAIETGMPPEIADTIYRDLMAQKTGATDLDDLLRPREADQERAVNAADASKKDDQKAVHERWVALRKALLAARENCGNKPVLVGGAAHFVRLVRRYSFNR